MEKIKFRILTDDVEVGDSINDAQKNIAVGIANIIKKNEQASIIGLQGPWGSGKSTIIKQVQNEFDIENDYIYFYFDAWAHEGDLLRKTFLVKLINTLLNNNKNVVKENSKTFNKIGIVKNKILSIPTPSLFQIILILSTLVVPFGTELISASKNNSFEYLNSTFLILSFLMIYLYLFLKNKEEKSSQNKSCLKKLYKFIPLLFLFIICIIQLYNFDFNSLINTFNVLFAIGFILSLAPIIVILSYFVGIFETEKVYLKNQFEFLSTFFKNNTVESSSMDFERYFNEVLELFPKIKFIVVIDNLDRIDHDDAKKIWSTLQIFLQHRNPSSNSESNEFYKNLWLIIPHDHNSLLKIWDSNASTENEKLITHKDLRNSNSQIINDSFLDKCFQIKIDVPPYTMNNWLDLFDKLLTKATDQDINTGELSKIRNIFIQTRKNISDAPSPREIKLFINQFGFLYSMHYPDVSIDAICFFVVDRFISKQSLDYIKKEIIEDKILSKSREFKISNKDYAALLYNLTPDEAIGIILKEEIFNALNSKDKNKIDQLIEIHKHEFWYTLNDLPQPKIINLDDLPDQINYFSSEQMMLFYEKYWNNDNFNKIKLKYIELISKDDKKSILRELKNILLEKNDEKIKFSKFLIKHLLDTNNPNIDSIIEFLFTFNSKELNDKDVNKITESEYDKLFDNIVKFEDVFESKYPLYFRTDLPKLAKYYISKKDGKRSIYLNFTNKDYFLHIPSDEFNSDFLKLLKYCFKQKCVGKDEINILRGKICEENNFVALIKQDIFNLFDLLTWIYNNISNQNEIIRFFNSNYNTVNSYLTLNDVEISEENEQNKVLIIKFFMLIGNQKYFQNNDLLKRYCSKIADIKSFSEMLKEQYKDNTFKEHIWSLLNTDSFNLILKLLNPKFENNGLYENLNNVLDKIKYLKQRSADKEIFSKIFKKNSAIEITSSDLIRKFDCVILLCEYDKKYLGKVKYILQSQQYNDEFLSLVEKSFPNSALKRANAKLIELQIESSSKFGIVNIFIDSKKYTRFQSTLNSRFSGGEYINVKEKLNNFIKKID